MRRVEWYIEWRILRIMNFNVLPSLRDWTLPLRKLLAGYINIFNLGINTTLRYAV